jgi:hypothetical protein
MGSTTELALSWTDLSVKDLLMLTLIAEDPRTIAVCPPMVGFLADCLALEVKHREDFATKRPQVPAWEDWSDGQVSDAYMCCCVIERACMGSSELLQQWASSLLHSTCLEMATRLEVHGLMRGAA